MGYVVAQMVDALRYKHKFAGSILDVVIGIFNSLNPSGRTNRNEYQGGKGGRYVGPTTLPPSYADYLLEP
jgi:hypothetical protein